MKNILTYSLLFILFTIIGTITHELGHYTAGKSLGLDCHINYAACFCLTEEQIKISEEARSLLETYGSRDSIPEEIYKDYISRRKAVKETKSIWVAIGGPLQTIITGTLGLIILLFRNRKFKGTVFNNFDWLFVFLSLFWLREPFNLILSITKRITYGSGSFFGGDEYNISRRLGLWEGSLSTILGLIGLMIVPLCCLHNHT